MLDTIKDIFKKHLVSNSLLAARDSALICSRQTDSLRFSRSNKYYNCIPTRNQYLRKIFTHFTRHLIVPIRVIISININILSSRFNIPHISDQFYIISFIKFPATKREKSAALKNNCLSVKNKRSIKTQKKDVSVSLYLTT